jgi:alpha-galactosidase
MLLFLSALIEIDNLTSIKTSNYTLISNGLAEVRAFHNLGKYTVVFKSKLKNPKSIIEAHSEFLDENGLTRTSKESADRMVSVVKVKDLFGAGLKLTLTNKLKNGPSLKQIFWVYKNRPEILTNITLSSLDKVQTKYLAPLVVSHSKDFSVSNFTSCLQVPYDNDKYARYSSDGWDKPSYGVGAIFNDSNRRGLLIGAIDHDKWKSAVKFSKHGAVTAFSGATGKLTHDQVDHGSVRGTEVGSSRFMIGHYSDWRDGLEKFGDFNSVVTPPLPWFDDIPWGWNSWSGHKSKLTATDAAAALDFISNELPWFRNAGNAYVNLDSYWDNLSQEELKSFVKKVRLSGLKAGIYWTPFVHWGNLEWGVDGQEYKYADLALKDKRGQPLEKHSGGYPLDPTHPGTLARIDRTIKRFVDLGFEFIKLDFLTHGALEGAHFDKSVQTGTQAYHVGMKRLVEQLSIQRSPRPVFIALSIAPLFPSGYGHSRRISCDVFANIGSSEYLLNSQTYSWWTAGRLYEFNDPDHTSVYQPKDEPVVTESEARTRLTASVIGGGKLMLGDDLTNPDARQRSKLLFANTEILDLARQSLEFRPVYEGAKSSAADVFISVSKDRRQAFLAMFNYSKSLSKTFDVPLKRIGLIGTWKAYNLWTKATQTTSGSISSTLRPTECVLLRLDKLNSNPKSESK